MSSENSSGSNNNQNTDFENALYLYPSDSPGMNLVGKPFNGTGFGSWKRAMTIALSAKNKIGFVNGTIAKPSSNSSDFRAWERCNDMVISWILNALDSEIVESVLYSTTASEIRLELENQYGQSNGANLYQVQKDLTMISQENSSISVYFTRFKSTNDKLESIWTLPPCSCGSATQIAKMIQDQKLVLFLMGLNGTYTIVRLNILMMSPLPSIGQAYALLIQEEKQREIQSSARIMTDSTSFNVMASKAQPLFMKNHNDNKKLTLICNHYKKPGHVEKNCYKWHGFPPGFKFRNKKFAEQANNMSQHVDEVQDSAGFIPGFTKSQCDQLMTLLNKISIGGTNKENVQLSAANFTGTFFLKSGSIGIIHKESLGSK